MLRMEYDETKTMDHIKEDYFEEGQAVGETIGAIKTKVALICKKLSKGMSQEDIAELIEEDISYVKEICEAIGDNPAECDVDEVVRKLAKWDKGLGDMQIKIKLFRFTYNKKFEKNSVD